MTHLITMLHIKPNIIWPKRVFNLQRNHQLLPSLRSAFTVQTFRISWLKNQLKFCTVQSWLCICEYWSFDHKLYCRVINVLFWYWAIWLMLLATQKSHKVLIWYHVIVIYSFSYNLESRPECLANSSTKGAETKASWRTRFSWSWTRIRGNLPDSAKEGDQMLIFKK